LLDWLIRRERLSDAGKLSAAYEGRRRLLHGLLNICPPQSLDGAFLDDMDQLLRDETNHKEIVDGGGLQIVSDVLPPRSLNNFERFLYHPPYFTVKF